MSKKISNLDFPESRIWYNDWISKNAKGNVLDVGKSIHWDYGFKTIDINKELNPTHLGNISETDFPDNMFDLVLCNGMYECVDDPQKMVDEVIRISKKAIFGFVGKNYEPYKSDWKFYDNNIKFKGKVEKKDFNDYHFIICEHT